MGSYCIVFLLPKGDCMKMFKIVLLLLTVTTVAETQSSERASNRRRNKHKKQLAITDGRSFSEALQTQQKKTAEAGTNTLTQLSFPPKPPRTNIRLATPPTSPIENEEETQTTKPFIGPELSPSQMLAILTNKRDKSAELSLAATEAYKKKQKELEEQSKKVALQKAEEEALAQAKEEARLAQLRARNAHHTALIEKNRLEREFETAQAELKELRLERRIKRTETNKARKATDEHMTQNNLHSYVGYWVSKDPNALSDISDDEL